MFGNVTIALFAALGAAIWIYRKTSRRGSGDFLKEISPALIAGILTFLIILTVLWQIF